MLDEYGIIQFENRACEQLLGYLPEELIGRLAFELIHPEDRDATFDVFKGLLANPEQTASVDFRFLNKDGTWRYLAAVAKIMLRETGVAGAVINCAMSRGKKKQNWRCASRKYGFDS